MSFSISNSTVQSLNRVQKTPALIFLFDGIDTPITSYPVVASMYLDEGFLLDEGLLLDEETGVISNQIARISFQSTTTKIDYKIDPDLGIGDSISSMRLSLVNDKKNTLGDLLSTYELLGRKVRVKISPDGPSAVYPKDYLTIYRGVVDEVYFEAGTLFINISHPDQKKRQTIFVEHKTELSAALNNSATTISVVDTSDFITRIADANGAYDTAFLSYVRINDEVIKYTGKTSTTLTTCVRGELGTTAASHDAGDEVTSFYVLTENCMDLALKIMLSGWAGPYVSNVPIASYADTSTIVFNGNLFDKYGLTVGDYITTTGAAASANNIENVLIETITFDEDANTTTLTVDTTELVDETTGGMVASFRSRYDTLPVGLKMSPEEVDILEHEDLKSKFLFIADMQFYIKSTIENAKDFITKEIYQPVACYALPKNAQASVGFTIPPLPDEEIKTFNTSNVKTPEKIKHLRQIGRNFYNTIIYKFNEDVLEDEFNTGLLTTDSDSRTQIPIGTKAFTIESKGLRLQNVVTSSATRRLFRYKFAAAQLQNIKTTMGEGYTIDIGDIVIVDGDSLLINDLRLGGGNTIGERYFQVVQKSIDLKTGDATFSLLDTSYDIDARYGYISPASYITSVAADNEFTLQTSFSWPSAEYTKWSSFVGASVLVRTENYSVMATGVIETVNTDNSIILVDDLAVTPSAGMLMEFSDYDDQGLALVKTLYTHVTDGSANFADGAAPYFMI